MGCKCLYYCRQNWLVACAKFTASLVLHILIFRSFHTYPKYRYFVHPLHKVAISVTISNKMENISQNLKIKPISGWTLKKKCLEPAAKYPSLEPHFHQIKVKSIFKHFFCIFNKILNFFRQLKRFINIVCFVSFIVIKSAKLISCCRTFILLCRYYQKNEWSFFLVLSHSYQNNDNL